jgi:hypothetical protein
MLINKCFFVVVVCKGKKMKEREKIDARSGSEKRKSLNEKGKLFEHSLSF